MFVDALAAYAQNDDRFMKDCRSWWSWRQKEPFDLQTALVNFLRFPEFCSLANYRLRSAGMDPIRDAKFKMANDLYFACPDIGGGLRIQHGHSTWLFAASVGENCHINQNVTVGVHKGAAPRIGNRVKICTGAVVVGPITIGDDVTIAPNAFVNFDVPSGKKVFPARSIIV